MNVSLDRYRKDYQKVIEPHSMMYNMYCSLVKEGPWAVHLTLGSNGRGGGGREAHLACIHRDN